MKQRKKARDLSLLELPEESVLKYEQFYGRPSEQMPHLISEGRKVMNFLDLIQRFNELFQTPIEDSKILDNWLDARITLGDGVIYHPDGRSKVVPDAEFLKELNERSEFVKGAVLLKETDWDKTTGLELSEHQTKICAMPPNYYHTHSIFSYLARNCEEDSNADSDINKFLEIITKIRPTRFNKLHSIKLSLDDRCSSGKRKRPVGRAITYTSFGNKSLFDATKSLTTYTNRLIGIAPQEFITHISPNSELVYARVQEYLANVSVVDGVRPEQLMAAIMSCYGEK
ncbi:hypothetical protein HN587_01515 [Candidatus Woesearchaeota archaeon]|nr:hypothetical protein [Candidatus Woesearchaeota archaeon]